MKLAGLNCQKLTELKSFFWLLLKLLSIDVFFNSVVYDSGKTANPGKFFMCG